MSKPKNDAPQNIETVIAKSLEALHVKKLFVERVHQALFVGGGDHVFGLLQVLFQLLQIFQKPWQEARHSS